MVSARCLSLFGLLAICFGTGLPKPCRVGWLAHGGLCYGFINAKLNWPEAQAFCNSLGGSKLPEPNLPANVFLETLARENNAMGLWLGGTNAEPDGLWRWTSTGQVFNQTKWGPDEPNNLAGNENCLQLFNPESGSVWDDIPCNYTLNFVCEYRP